MKKVEVIQKYNDLQLKAIQEKGKILRLEDDRADHLESLKLIKVLEIIKPKAPKKAKKTAKKK